MTEPTSQQRALAFASARAAAETALRGERDRMLKSVFSTPQLKLVDKWIAANNPTLDRSEAIRRLVELGLKAKPKS